jgi:MFS family permease
MTATSRTRPVVFLVLMLPFGVMSGYLTVTIAYQLSHAGWSVDEIAALVAASFIPHTWKFLWAPIADTTLKRRTWYLLAAAVSAVGVWATGAVPGEPRFVPLLYAVVIVSNFAVTFLAMAAESLMVYGTDPARHGRAAGWFQAGNLGGFGLGGGAGLWMAEHLSQPWIAGTVLGVACALCSVALVFVAEPPAAALTTGSARRRVVEVLKDVWHVARTRPGYLALLICFLPIGSGAASNLWSAVADDWHASADTVALVTGALNGVVSAAGCLAGGYLADRIDRKSAYALYGLALAVCAAAMAWAPRTEPMYVAFTTAYALIQGLCYAGFSAVVLEAIGLGAAATKYTLYGSLSNMPIMYMTVINGAAHTRWGAGGMLYTEALVGVLGLLAFFGAAFATAPAARIQQEQQS